MTDIELAVLKALKGRYGRDHAIYRERLVYEVNAALGPYSFIGDRAVREAIENLRQTHPPGARIMSSSGRPGYWLAESFEEFEALYQEQRSRALNIMGGLRKQRDLLRREWHEPQMELNL
ncbi:hypothetical protein LCGC14_2184330 [marine sediment metagenome]|uniref:Uncharacterized protein n=1 Tax=marine sediment metagenome TaxID=412755 RepID=A0A0F9FYS5_9ZZZZ